MTATTTTETETTTSNSHKIGRCRVCKVARRVTVRVVTTWRLVGDWGRMPRGKQTTVDGIKVRPSMAGTFSCCGQRHSLKRINGRTTDHECDARCMAATGHSCECSCGGANHGAAHVAG